MGRIADFFFVRKRHVCPWWCCFTFDNPLRRLLHDPDRILSPYVRPGHTVVDIGPGMGFFTVDLCRLVGEDGKVIALDVQRKMLEGLAKRVRREGLSGRLETRLVTGESFDIDEKADFVLAFWMVHEVPDQARFFGEVAALLKPTGTFLMAEPYLHVTGRAFSKTVETAATMGLKPEESPKIAWSRSVLFSLSDCLRQAAK